jgi:membrane protein
MPVAIIASAVKRTGSIIWNSLEEFMRDNCPQMAGALSFYTLFTLPPLLVLTIMIAEPFLEPEAVVATFRQEIRALLGPDGSEQVHELLEHLRRPGAGGPAQAAVGIVAFLFGLTAAFAQLQNALNAAWAVGPDPRRGDVKNFLVKRILSFAMIAAVGFILLVSLILSAMIGAFGDFLALLLPGALTAPLLQLMNELVSFAVVTFLFAAMFKYLPDAVVAWRHALIGGAVTALLFTVGKTLIGLYLGQADPGHVYGAAGSLAIVLIWVYYSSMILFFGAEFTQVWARFRGSPIRPVPGAVRILKQQERVEDGLRMTNEE